ncbi:ankyrin repeat domain-containing protein [Purpureocillium lilacinum]|uniref:Ankyrin repeat domain-containing protein n=1 Tax=Purpureocillium lilacinum TaxID=33203 RepID=A0A179GVW8_PURLI|nr:ankyrin repeat domain-containing protein [Purpureocillium lilacinum]
MDEEPDRFPLHTAARLGQVSRAEALLKAWHPRPWHENDPKLAKKQDDDGRYAVHWAASSNSFQIMLMLAELPGFDPDVQDGSGWTALMIAASVADSEPILTLLLQRGADVNEKNGSGQTALHFVASKKNMDVARLLLAAKPPASTRVRDRRGQYPIHRAAAVGSVPMTTLLLRNRSPLNPTDGEGFTPLHHAVAEGHGDVAVALLKEGADFTIRNSADELALDLAPDKEVRLYIMRGAEREGIDLSSPS